MFGNRRAEAIYGRCHDVCSNLRDTIDMMDGSGAYDEITILSFMGFMFVNVASVVDPKVAKKVESLFASDYARNKRWSEETIHLVLADYGYRVARIIKRHNNYNEIVSAQSRSLCLINEWDYTEKNTSIVYQIIDSFCDYLNTVKNK